MTALHYACKYGHYEVVQLLIDAKADISIQDIVRFGEFCYPVVIYECLIRRTSMHVDIVFKFIVASIRS